ncbi:hypothetical protein E4U14_000655, partial [Claviceps sp. LM454 group G7]
SGAIAAENAAANETPRGSTFAVLTTAISAISGPCAPWRVESMVRTKDPEQ